MSEPTPDEFDLDAAWVEMKRPPFHFRWAGVSWELPHLGDVDWRVVALADEMDLPKIQEALHLGLGERASEFDEHPQNTPAMFKLFDRWMEHSGMRPGEAPGSDDSSGSTDEPSPQTSTDTTESASVKPSSGRRKAASPSVS